MIGNNYNNKINHKLQVPNKYKMQNVLNLKPRIYHLFVI